MAAILDILLSPAGIAAYAAFWVFKILAGAWVVRQLAVFLPAGPRLWIENKISVGRRGSINAPGPLDMK